MALGMQINSSGLCPTSGPRHVLNLPDLKPFANGCGKYRTHDGKMFIRNLICGSNFIKATSQALHLSFELIELLPRYG